MEDDHPILHITSGLATLKRCDAKGSDFNQKGEADIGRHRLRRSSASDRVDQSGIIGVIPPSPKENVTWHAPGALFCGILSTWRTSTVTIYIDKKCKLHFPASSLISGSSGGGDAETLKWTDQGCQIHQKHKWSMESCWWFCHNHFYKSLFEDVNSKRLTDLWCPVRGLPTPQMPTAARQWHSEG